MATPISSVFPATYITSQLQTGTTPTGAEIVEVIQGGNSVQLSVGQLMTANLTGLLPSGGTTGQVLAKNSGSNFDVAWINNLSQINAGTGISATGSTTVTIGLASAAALSVLGVTGAANATSVPISGTAAQVLRVNDAGNALAFGALNLGSAAAITGVLPVANGGIGTSVAGQYPGTNTNDSAATGNVGEFLFTSLPFASALTLTSNVATTVISLQVSAGDWNIFPVVAFTGATTTLVYYLSGTLSNTAGILNTTAFYEGVSIPGLHLAAFTSTTVVNTPTFPMAACRRSVAAPTTFYLVAQSGFDTSTNKAFGAISARRAR